MSALGPNGFNELTMGINTYNSFGGYRVVKDASLVRVSVKFESRLGVKKRRFVKAKRRLGCVYVSEAYTNVIVDESGKTITMHPRTFEVLKSRANEGLLPYENVIRNK